MSTAQEETTGLEFRTPLSAPWGWSEDGQITHATPSLGVVVPLGEVPQVVQMVRRGNRERYTLDLAGVRAEVGSSDISTGKWTERLDVDRAMWPRGAAAVFARALFARAEQAPKGEPQPSAGQRPGTKGLDPIPGMKAGWYVNPRTLEILHAPSANAVPLPVCQVPPVVAQITSRATDGRRSAIRYRLHPAGADHGIIVTEDDVDTGQWADALEWPRPSGKDAVLASAVVIRSQVVGDDAAPVLSSTSYRTADGGIVLPDPDAQDLGYLATAGVESDAREAWRALLDMAAGHGRTALAVGAAFAAPMVCALPGVPAHVLNLTGESQRGKSTTLAVAASTMGAADAECTEGLTKPWTTSPEGLPGELRSCGLLPAFRNERSALLMPVKDFDRLLSACVVGAGRTVGRYDGQSRQRHGSWNSILLSTSNQPLRHQGQTEDLGVRLYELRAPFWCEEVNFRPSRLAQELATGHHGWPLVWARDMGLYGAGSVAWWRSRWTELTTCITTAAGGVDYTIASVLAAWVMGAEMLEHAVSGADAGAGPLARAALDAARDHLAPAVADAQEARPDPGLRLWEALSAARTAGAVFPTVEELAKRRGDRQAVSGFLDDGAVWVLADPLRALARGCDTEGELSAVLAEWIEAGIVLPGTGRNRQRLVTPKRLRPLVGARAYCVDIAAAEARYAPLADGEDDGADDWEPEGEQDWEDGPESRPEPGRQAPLAVSVPRHRETPRGAVPAPRRTQAERLTVDGVAQRVDTALRAAEGDMDEAAALLSKGAIPDVMEMLDALRANGRYDFTRYPGKLDVFARKAKGKPDQVWDGRPNWTAALPEGTPILALDVNGAYLSAFNTHLPIGSLTHDTSGAFDPKRSGVYLVTPGKWLREDLPNPIGNRETPGALWVPRPLLEKLLQLSREDDPMCEAPQIHEAYTSGSTEALLRPLRELLAQARDAAIAGGDDLTLNYVKDMYSKLVSTVGDSGSNYQVKRPDWGHILRSRAYINLWGRARKLRDAGIALHRVAGTDEIHITEGDWRSVFPEGRGLAQMKVKDTYRIGDVRHG